MTCCTREVNDADVARVAVVDDVERLEVVVDDADLVHANEFGV